MLCQIVPEGHLTYQEDGQLQQHNSNEQLRLSGLSVLQQDQEVR